VGTAGDITRRKSALAALEAARLSAEAESRAKSAFFSRIGHEVRTPVYGMLGMAELLANTGLNPNQTQLVSTLRESGLQMMQVVDDLLDFSRLEAGQLHLDVVPFVVRDAVDTALQPLRTQAAAKGVTMRCELASGVPARVRGDPERFRQVLAQVAGNAVKFTEKGRVDITVTVARWEDTVATLNFLVADTGGGIPADTQATVFDAFVKANKGDARNYGGAGLGLSLSRALLKLMGGDIQLVGSSAAGSVFSYTVKVSVDKAAVRGGVVTQPSIPLGLKVLLVDDNAVNRAVGKGLLKTLKCEVDVASDGAQAVEASAAKPYDLVLMDCYMPVLDGYEATARIREREKASNAPRLPIIALTANALPGSREICIASGMDDYLTKPCTREDLERVIMHWAVPHAVA
jgi:two-component system, sensor histidine kinase